MDSCWESGGPEWFFGAMLASGILAVLGAGWWATTRAKSVRTKRQGGGAMTILIVLIFLAAVVAAGVRPGAWGWALIIGTSAVSWVTAEASQRQAVATEAGVPLTGGWGTVYRAVRRGVPVMVVLAVVAAVGFLVASILLGGPCT